MKNAKIKKGSSAKNEQKSSTERIKAILSAGLQKKSKSLPGGKGRTKLQAGEPPLSDSAKRARAAHSKRILRADKYLKKLCSQRGNYQLSLTDVIEALAATK